MLFKKAIPFDIIIKPSANEGFIVQVGCCTAVYQDPKELIENLEEFLLSPDSVTKQYSVATQDSAVEEVAPERNTEQPTLARGR